MNKLTRYLLVLLVILLPFTTAQASIPATWSATDSMAIPRARHTATLLSDGRVLVTGGLDAGGTTATSEIYDVSSGTWGFTGSMLMARSRHTATLLANGKVLVVGGRVTNQGPTLATAELYDPNMGTWSPTGSMANPRDNHVATLLPDGRVLVTGGVSGNDTGPIVTKSAEIYDPLTSSWTTIDHMASARYSHQATLLADGSVLVTGGFNSSAFHIPMKTAEIFDPQTNTWSNAALMSTPRSTHLSFLLSDGRVLVTGGWTQPPDALTPTATVEIYDPTTDSWLDSFSLQVARGALNGVMFADGSILIVGGGDGTTQLATAELYDSVTGMWDFTGSLSNSRSSSTITLLADGRVLVTGGGNASGVLSSAEVYSQASFQDIVVYDNQVGETDGDADPTTAIGGGNIKIQKESAAYFALQKDAEYALSQNCPNPANPSTQIAYQLPEASEVSLIIYNVMGQAVCTLAAGSQGAGYYQVTWDGRDDVGREVSSGVYLYRFVSNGLVKTKKMLLLK